MALNQTREWVVAYDISDPRRLGRVHRLMLKNGVPMQKSVFTAMMTPLEARKLRDKLAVLIDAKADDVRMYPLPAKPEITRLGRTDLRSGGVFLE